jgi:hypothetical protein
MTNAELRALVADTLLVWGGDARAAWDGDALRVTAADGRAAALTRGGPGRWMLAVEGGRTRPSASITGLLEALRRAVGPRDPEPALRVTAPPDA